MEQAWTMQANDVSGKQEETPESAGGGEPTNGETAAALSPAVVAELERLVSERAIVEVEVLERIRGGLRVRYGDLIAFLPTSLATAKRYPTEGELRELLGQRIHVLFHELRKDAHGNITPVVSRRHFLEDLALERLKVGDIVEGTVTRLTVFGAFVDVGGIEGLIPTAELDHVPVLAPNKVLELGQTVRVQVIGIDLAKRQVRLSRKALLPSPWQTVGERYPVGSRVRGVVRRVLPKAALVNVEPGIDGIVPVEELSWTERITHPAQVLSAGQEAEFVVLEVVPDQKRMVLSLRRTQPNPWEGAAERYPVGSRVTVTVRRLTATATIVELPDGLSGIIPVAELSWKQQRPAPSSILQPGQTIEAVVLQVEPERRLLVLSYRQTQPNPWDHVEERFPIGSRLRAQVRRVLPRGALVEIEDGLEAFLPLSELSWTRRLRHAAELLQAGQEIECVVLDVSAAQQRLVVSLRQAQPNPWPELAQQYPVGSEHEAVFLQQQTAGSLVRLGDDVDAFMPRSSYAPLLRRTRQPWQPGDRLRVRILELNPEELSVVVEPILETPARTPQKPAAQPRQPRPAPVKPAAPAEPPRKSPARPTEKRTTVTLADLLPEEVRQKLLQGGSS